MGGRLLLFSVSVSWCSQLKGLLRGKPLQITHSFFRTQGSLPSPLSLHRAHLEWVSNPAIACPHEPLLCPGDDIVVDNTSKLLQR